MSSPERIGVSLAGARRTIQSLPLRVARSALITSTFYSALATITRMLAGLVVIKVVAVHVGPAGVALIGQFQNFVTMTNTLATAGIDTAVVKYVAEYRDDVPRRRRLLATAVWIMLLSTTIVAASIVTLHGSLSRWLFATEAYAWAFLLFGCTFGLGILNGLILAVLNGYRQVGRLTSITITANLVGVALAYALVTRFGIEGSFLALISAPAVVFIITVVRALGGTWIPVRDFVGQLDRESFIKLTHYTAMAITTALSLPLSLMFIRRYLTEAFSPDAAGYWQAIWRISDTYLALVTVTLSVYYLPRLSELRERAELRQELRQAFCLIMPVVIAIAAMIYLLRDWIVHLLFAPSFLPMRELFAAQLIGDCIKVASWLLGYLMVARAMTRAFVITEIASTLSFVLLLMLLTHYLGIKGTVYAFALNYALYLICLLWIFRSLLWSRPQPRGRR